MDNNQKYKYKYSISADNHYELLGLKPFSNISKEELDRAKAERTKYWHNISGDSKINADKNDAKQELTNAYNVLINVSKRRRYDKELKERLLKRLDDVIAAYVKIDKELDPNEKKAIMQKGKSLGFKDYEIIEQIKENLERYNAKEVGTSTKAPTPSPAPQSQPVITTQGQPVLEIVGKESFKFSDVKLGTTRTATFTVKNGGGGSLDATIKSNAKWLSANPTKIHQSNLPQLVTIKVDPSADLRCNLGFYEKSSLSLIYNINGRNIIKRVAVDLIMEGHEKIVKRLTKVSTSIIATLSGLYLIYIFNHLYLSGWNVFGLVITVLTLFASYGAISDGENGGWAGVLFACIILYLSSSTIFFLLLPIPVIWLISKPVFSHYPLKTYLAGVIPVSLFLLNLVGIGLVNGGIPLPSFNSTEDVPVMTKKSIATKKGFISSKVGVKIRTGPSTKYPAKGSLKNGKSIELVKKEGTWYYIRYNENGQQKDGYVYGPLVSLGDEPQKYITKKKRDKKGLSSKTRSNYTSKKLENIIIIRDKSKKTYKNDKSKKRTSEKIKSSDKLKSKQSSIKEKTFPYSAVSQKPVIVKRVDPIFPEFAKKNNLEGTVLVNVLVGTNGYVEKVKLFKSFPPFDASALAAAKMYVFTPGRQRGRLVKVWMTIPINFTLEQKVSYKKYKDLNGEWNGNVKQLGYGSYLVDLHLFDMTKGKRCGSINYPSFKCLGILTFVKKQNNEFILKETIVSGKCLDSGIIHIKKLNNETISWAWFNSQNGKKGASGILNLKTK